MLKLGRIVDRYQVLSLLGRGGQAEVYAARHLELGSLHAIKLLTLGSESMRKRALQEGRIQAGLRHPNIVGVSDILRIDGAPALVMELVRGPPLEQAMLRINLSVLQVDALGRGIMSGVLSAHDSGLIHRDLKPGNILLDPLDDGQVVPRVMDFGLAKVLDSGDLSLSRTGMVMGTPSFMAPEQFRDAKDVDERADVYALGAILYELLTGMLPFPGGDMIEIYEQIQAGQLIPPSKLRNGVAPRMDNAIRRALSFEREQRPGSVSELMSLWTEGRELPRQVWTKDVVEMLLEMGPQVPDAPPESQPDAPPPSEATRVPEGFVSEPPLPAPPSPDSQSSEAALPPPAKGGWKLGVAALALLALGAGAWWLLRQPEPVPEPQPVVEPVDNPVAPEVTSPAEADVEPLPEPAVPEEEAPSPAVEAASPPPTRSPSKPKDTAPASEETPAPPDPEVLVVPPEQTPEPAEVSTGWSLAGVDRGYALDTSGARHAPGSVAPGVYDLFVFFDDAKATRVLSVDVKDQQTLRVVCDTSMRVCKTR